MSNEEIVARIQAGEQELMGELWEQVDGLVKWKAKHVMTALDGRGGCGVEFGDLYNSGFPAMVAAVETYQAESGSFSTWFMFHLKNAFAEITGYRTKKGQNEPLNRALSLSMPIGKEEDDGVLAHIIPDPKASATMEAVEEQEYQEQLRKALETALGTLPETCGDVLRLRYYRGQTLTEAGEALGVVPERVRQMENRGLRILRQPKNAACLRPFYEYDFYCHTGMSAFLHTGMSVQERYLIVEEERRERKLQRQRLADDEWKRRKEELEKQEANQRQSWEREREEIMAELSPENRERLRRMLHGGGA